MSKNLLLALCGLSLGVSAFADERNNSPQNMPKCERKTHDSRFQIGGDYTHVNFKPHGTPSYKGNLGGFQAMYEYRPVDFIYGAARFEWKEGHMTGSAGRRSFLLMDGQERLGYTLGCDKYSGYLSLYTGFGYRYVNQKLTPKTGGDLTFRYNEFYVPVGFIAGYRGFAWLEPALEFTWMPQVFPTVTINPLEGARWKLNDILQNFYVAIPLDFTLTCDGRFHLIIKPFYEYWQDGHTTAKTSTGIPLGLPGNTYNYAGVDVNFGFCF